MLLFASLWLLMSLLHHDQAAFEVASFYVNIFTVNILKFLSRLISNLQLVRQTN